MNKRFSTDSVQPSLGGSYWRHAISEALFNLQITLPSPHTFRGELVQSDLSNGSLSRLTSGALSSRRLKEHCDLEDRQVLLTLPVQGTVEFTQFGRTTRCGPGQFVLEMSEEPYEFGYGDGSEMLVWKLPASTLRAHVGDPRRFSARQYDVNSGIGQVFNDYLKLVARQVEQNANPHLRALMDAHLVELLALTLQQHPDALQSQQSSIRDAHLARIEAYVQQHLSDPNLTPTQISKACRISLRYLHSLFRETGTPVSQWIRELRLQLAHESLRRATKPGYIATVAYDCGFNDHPKFTHAFRKKYGYTPSDLLRNVRADSSGPN